MSYKIIGGTQANWLISIVDGYYRISETINRYIGKEFENKFLILWAWQTESGLEKIRNETRDSEIFFMTDKSKAEVIGCGKWIKELGNMDLSSYWKDQPQWNKKWEFPYLLEVIQLDKRFFEKIRNLTEEERLSIVNNKVISKREIFGKIDLIRITDPEGGAFWETKYNQQDTDINNAKANFMPISEEILNIKPNFWWVCQGDSYTEERGHKFIWAPHKDKSGKFQYHWDNVRKVKEGDIIFKMLIRLTQVNTHVTILPKRRNYMGTFSSDNSIESVRFQRQKKRCAVCGHKIAWSNFQIGTKGSWDAHHIDGNPNNNQLSNCACVCSSCHFYKCHSENLETGALLPKLTFRLVR